MATTVATVPNLVAIDANFLIGFCAKEPDKHAITKSELVSFATRGVQVFAPGVIVSESLFVLCKKLEKGDINKTEHDTAVRSLNAIMRAFSPPPNGDASLIARAEEIRGGRTCKRTTDGTYIALAEELAKIGTAELLTFDDGLSKQATIEAPTVTVRLLLASTSAPPSGISLP